MSRSSAAIQLARSNMELANLVGFILALCGLVLDCHSRFPLEVKSAQELDLLQADQIASLNPGDPRVGGRSN